MENATPPTPKGRVSVATITMVNKIVMAMMLGVSLFLAGETYASTRIYTLDYDGHGVLLVRPDGTIAVIEEPNGFVCIGLEPYRADCHPALNLPPVPEGFPEEGQ